MKTTAWLLLFGFIGFLVWFGITAQIATIKIAVRDAINESCLCKSNEAP